MISRNWKILVTTFLPGPLIVGFKSATLPSVLFLMSKDLGLRGFELGIVFSIQSVTGMIFGIASGILTDRVGIKQMYRIGVAIMSLGLFFLAFSLDLYTLMMLYFITSFGLTLYAPPLLKFLASLFSDNQRGLAIGVLGSGVRLSAAATFLVVPLVLFSLGSWRWVFACFGAASLILALFTHYQLRKETFEDSRAKVLNFSATSDLGHILRSRNVILTALSRIFHSFSTQSFSAFLPFLLQLTGSSLFTASLVATMFWVGQAAGEFLIPRISDVINRRVLLITTLAPVASFLIFALALSWGNTVMVLIITTMLGLIFAGLVEITFLIPLADPQIKVRHAGGATGVLQTLGSLGGIFSTLVVGLLIDISGQNIWSIFSVMAVPLLFMALVSIFMKEIGTSKS